MFGLKLAEITPELRTKFGLPEDARGVVITDVVASSDAADRGLRAGDVIYEVNQADVGSPADVEANVDKAKKAGRKWVLLGVSRQGNLQFVPLKVTEG
jgi:serine protease Do